MRRKREARKDMEKVYINGGWQYVSKESQKEQSTISQIKKAINKVTKKSK